ncbi:MAG TPA: hypothetical protein VJM53_00090 [Burkholderiales bacterium]|nr:hypothetical protein [Burkholderiales bacterium]
MKLFKSIAAALNPRAKDGPKTTQNVAVFFFSRPPNKEEIQALASNAKVKITPDWGKTRVAVEWEDVRLMLSIDAKWNSADHVPGIRGWIEQVAGDEPAPPVRQFFTDLSAITSCYGCVLTPGFDGEGKCFAFLLGLLEGRGGFYFCHQSFYDARGQRIFGDAGDPETMGPAAQTSLR